MLGWLSSAVVRASWVKRASPAASPVVAGASTLSATRRFSRVSRARYPGPWRPAAIRLPTTYGPSREPVARRPAVRPPAPDGDEIVDMFRSTPGWGEPNAGPP